MTESEWVMGNRMDPQPLSSFADGDPAQATPYVRALFEDLLNAAIAQANNNPQSAAAMEARQFLLEENEWFSVVCAGAGIHSTALREHLRYRLSDKSAAASLDEAQLGGG